MFSILFLSPSLCLSKMGLLLDLSPDGGMDGGGNEKELEAELLALMGGGGSQGKKGTGKGHHHPHPLSSPNLV